jgi:hypothetical protein
MPPTPRPKQDTSQTSTHIALGKPGENRKTERALPTSVHFPQHATFVSGVLLNPFFPSGESAQTPPECIVCVSVSPFQSTDRLLRNLV